MVFERKKRLGRNSKRLRQTVCTAIGTQVGFRKSGIGAWRVLQKQLRKDERFGKPLTDLLVYVIQAR
jgi:hypothetical protein